MRWTLISANQQASFVSFSCLYGVIVTVWPIEESVTPISSSAPELYDGEHTKTRLDPIDFRPAFPRFHHEESLNMHLTSKNNSQKTMSTFFQPAVGILSQLRDGLVNACKKRATKAKHWRTSLTQMGIDEQKFSHLDKVQSSSHYLEDSPQKRAHSSISITISP